MGWCQVKNIEEILELLSWSNSAEDQERGRDMAQNIEDISELIQPDVGGKSAWDNCAKVLCKKTDEQLEPYLCELLEWIQDINWPGAMLILGRLKHFSGIKLKEPVENAVKKAKGMQENGLMWIDYLSELLDNESLEKCLSKATLTCLQQHYHNWAAWYQE